MDLNLRGRVRAGDPEAFEELFDEHVQAVYNHGFRLTGSWSTAEEVVSLTFLEAWRIRRRVDIEGGSLRPWLLGIATNVTRNLRRTARRHQAVLTAMPAEEPALPDFADDVVTRMENAQRLGAVQAALQTLSRPELEVVALCVWSELSYPDAAKALGVPVGTVRSRLSRARRKLQRELLDTRRQIDGDRGIAVRFVQEETP